MDTLAHLGTTLAAATSSGWGDGFLWVVQWSLGVGLVVGNVLAAVLIVTGRFDRHRMPAMSALSPPMLAFLGASHVAGGLGLVLPQATGVWPWLTPVAAGALAVQAFMAAGYHLRVHEDAVAPALWGVLFGAVALGRLDLVGDAQPISPTAIAVAIVAVFAALTATLVLVLRGSRNPFRQPPSAGPDRQQRRASEPVW